ncbi:hypothetical protein [Nesterenkonia flava]|uniref:Lipoprotein n=1 Tax=Nesterenkonia flava TaxID=469799 RepID=A0ABU1FS88_9MICC|nr:hypothetical protein [Nesterenkonia flava]MDR5711538.1 hypothetical protein [Nesterenkonia flava]
MDFPLRESAAALGLVSLLALTACAPGDEENGSAEGSRASSTTEEGSEERTAEGSAANEATDAEHEESDDESAPASSPQDQTIDAQDAQQTITYPMTGEVDGEITMGLHSLEVQGETMLLTVSFVPEYDDGDEIAVFTRDMHTVQFENVTAYLLPQVIDRQHMKSYYVPGEDGFHRTGWASDTFHHWASTVDHPVPSGETLIMWAHFPAPEDDVETVDVSVVPGVQEFRDVEIDWGAHSPADTDDSDETPDDDESSEDADTEEPDDGQA